MCAACFRSIGHAIRRGLWLRGSLSFLPARPAWCHVSLHHPRPVGEAVEASQAVALCRAVCVYFTAWETGIGGHLACAPILLHVVGTLRDIFSARLSRARTNKKIRLSVAKADGGFECASILYSIRFVPFGKGQYFFLARYAFTLTLSNVALCSIFTHDT